MVSRDMYVGQKSHRILISTFDRAREGSTIENTTPSTCHNTFLLSSIYKRQYPLIHFIFCNMGGTVGIRDPYDYSLSNDPLDDSFSGKRRNSHIYNNKEGTKKVYPVKSDSLGVPMYNNRHPFQDYRFMKKLGE
jgi:hypothetical protein